MFVVCARARACVLCVRECVVCARVCATVCMQYKRCLMVLDSLCSTVLDTALTTRQCASQRFCGACSVFCTVASTSTLTASPTTATPTTLSPTDGGRWLLGDGGGTCDSACTKQGMACSEQQLWAHNSEVDSATELKALIGALGGSTAADCNNFDYPVNADVPSFSTGECYASASNRDIGTFKCSAETNPAEKRRLCYCNPRTLPCVTTCAYMYLSAGVRVCCVRARVCCVRSCVQLYICSTSDASWYSTASARQSSILH